jgi:dihydroorotate dehydrogenase electron transfer subunit
LPPVVATSQVIRNTREAPTVFRLWIAAPQIARDAMPGQFVNIRVAEGVTPLLRRPFSFCEIDPAGGCFSLLYQVVGQGTTLLSHLRPGMSVSVVGPLGRPFTLHPAAPVSILCAGGIGVAPFPAVARGLAGRSQVRVILGARNASLCLCQDDFASMGIPVELATEDGSAGVQGFVTDPLRQALQAADVSSTMVYACGPQPMLAAVARLCEEYNCPAELSVEAVMGCGVGACLSCVFLTPDGQYVRSCAEGPVFRPGEILF